MEFDGDVARTGKLQNAGSPIAVEGELRIGIVVRQNDAVPPADGDGALEVFGGGNRRGGIVGIVEEHELGAGQPLLGKRVQVDKEIRLRSQRGDFNVRPGQQRAAEVRRVPRFGDDAHVSRVENSKRQMRQTLFRADERQDLTHGIDRYAEPSSHEAGHGFPVFDQPQLEPVAAHTRVLRRLVQTAHREGGWGYCGVAGPEVDDVNSLRHQLPFALGDLPHGVDGQSRHALAWADHAGAPTPCNAKNSSAAVRTSSQVPTTRRASGNDLINVGP